MQHPLIMRYILIVLSTLFIVCCKNNESSTKTTGNAADSIDQRKDSIAKTRQPDLEQIKTELESLTPLTEDQLLSMLPASISGTKASETSTSVATGAITASAVYQENDSTRIKIDIIDCAGPAGA